MSDETKPVIIYLSPYDILRPRTNQVSDVRFCEGFAQNNAEVHLVVPFVKRKDNIDKEDVARIYGLEKHIHIHYLPYTFNTDIKGFRRVFIVSFLAYLTVKKIIKNLPGKIDVFLLSRSVFLLKPFLKNSGPGKKSRLKIIHWAHDLKLKPNYISVYKNCDAVIATNSSIREDLIKATGIPRDKTAVTLNPVTESQVNTVISKEEACRMLGMETIPHPLIVYTGKIGIEYNRELIFILEAASKLPGYNFLFTGGKPDAVSRWKAYCNSQNIKNVTFTGYIPDYSIIRYYQQVADILISYYTSQGHDTRYNFPNKICEYMMTGNIIVTPDFPATRDVLHKDNCNFTEPENPESLVNTIKYTWENRNESAKKAELAMKEVRNFTFRKKTAEILGFFSTLG